MLMRSLTRWTIAVAFAFVALTITLLLVAQPTAQARPQAATVACAGPIQACIDAASDGDTIVVGAGTYTESLTLSKPVSLTGVNSATTIIHAMAGQRVLTVTEATISNSVVISGLTFTGGDADNGGGIYSDAPLTVMSSRFFNNTTSGSGGGIYAVSALTLTNVDVLSNTASTSGGGLYVSGIATISNTDFISNTAQQSGGGADLLNSARIVSSRFEGNQTLNGNGGGLLSLSTSLELTGTKFIRNSAINFAGGGLAYGGEHARIVNTLFAGNSANMLGAALTIYQNAETEILNSTFTDPGSNPQWAITNIGSALHVTNTIITSHSLGIAGTYQMTTGDYNLFFGNLNNTVGVTNGTHSLIGDPKFVDPANGDYHLQFGSAAIDHGIDVNIYTDLDGNPRPVNRGFDIGAYEYQTLIQRIYLPLMRKNS